MFCADASNATTIKAGERMAARKTFTAPNVDVLPASPAEQSRLDLRVGRVGEPDREQRLGELVALDRSFRAAVDANLDAGTRFVIGFRSRYLTAQALAFSARFYREWAGLDLDPDALAAAFTLAARQCPHAEPVLYSADGVYRAYARTMQQGSGVVEILDAGTPVAPHFPQP